MGRFDVKNEKKAPLDANKIGKLFGSGNTAWREDFNGTSKALNVLQVKFNCGEGNEGGGGVVMFVIYDCVYEH